MTLDTHLDSLLETLRSIYQLNLSKISSGFMIYLRTAGERSLLAISVGLVQPKGTL